MVSRVIHHAPSRNRVDMSAPGIPTSLHHHAERVVIERARELMGATETTFQQSHSNLEEAVRVLDVLEGKR